MKKHAITETLRKSIHLSSMVIPLSYKYLLHYNRALMFRIVLFLAILSIVIELIRLERPTVKRIFHKLFGLLLRRHEMRDFTGATYMMVSSVICVAFLSPNICFCSMAFLSIGDTFAAIVGMSAGKRKLFGTKKSLEGGLACFLSTFIFGLFFLPPLVAFFGALSTAMAEITNIPVDDNIRIPLIAGIVMSIVSIFI
ncbi:MAG TPA: phosphatidate cytidylyltransferase [Candidatus Cloacimonadota bacterium]|nr:phosphatidate cytidylyltransferase [Candidatus Cloacimonadota bacterium]HPT72938.1 phosphatidate cytidylyltransferase [Candidatus Cloacimonadota bacterium]